MYTRTPATARYGFNHKDEGSHTITLKSCCTLLVLPGTKIIDGPQGGPQGEGPERRRIMRNENPL